MERVTPEKNEAAFRKWDWERRWLIRGFWIIVSLFFILIVVVDPLVYLLVPAFITEVTAPGVEEPWRLPATVVLGLLYVIVLIVIRWCYIEWELGRLSKEACVFAAIVTAEDLETGNPVRASLSIDKLLLALSDYLGQKLVTLGSSSATPNKYMQVTPETIPKRAVFRAIQASGDTKDFQERLRNLAVGLAGNMDTGYLTTHQFLVWLNREAEPYRLISQSFLDKRPTLRTMLLNVCPIILPPLAGIVTALLVK